MIVVFLCSFYLVNLILAIVAMSYDDCQKREQAEIEEEYAAALVCRHSISSFLPTDAPVVCLCVCVRLSVCLSHAGVVSKRLNMGSRQQRSTIALRF